MFTFSLLHYWYGFVLAFQRKLKLSSSIACHVVRRLTLIGQFSNLSCKQLTNQLWLNKKN